MRQIKLSKGQTALVDDSDYDNLALYAWHALKTPNGFYAVRTVRKGEKSTKVYMHRQISGALPGELTDHEDGDGLNNQRRNLKITSSTGNQRNRRKHKINSSPHVGVEFYARTGSWRARIRVNGEQLSLGYFSTQTLALEARREAEKRYWEK